MNQTLKFFTVLLSAAIVCASSALPAQGQARTVKEANKINEKRNDQKSKYTPMTERQLDFNSKFVVAAASSNMLEIALGKLAEQKGIAMEVRDWGKKMQAEHAVAENDLRTIANQANIALPKAMSDDARDLYSDVDDRKYLGFDKKYLRSLKEQHARDLKLYAEAATKLTNPALQQYVARMLPELRQHELMIDKLYERANDRK